LQGENQPKSMPKQLQKYMVNFLIITLGLISVIVIPYELAYQEKIYPGVKIAGQALGNQTKVQAQNLLENSIETFLKGKTLTVITDQQTTEIDLENLGLNYQIEKNMEKAYRFGRKGDFWEKTQQKIKSWKEGVDFTLDYELDQNYLHQKTASLAAQVYVPAIEPSIQIVKNPASGQSEITVNRGQAGQKLNLRLFNNLLNQKLARLDSSSLELPLLVISPGLTGTEVEKITQEAEKLLRKKLILSLGEKTWDLNQEELISFLSFSGGFDRFRISQYISQLAESVDQPPINATFQFKNGRVVEFRPAKEGQALNQPKTMELIINSLSQLQEEKIIELPITLTKPAVTTAEVNNLGIKELIGKGESFFAGSISSRIHNIKLASSKLNGELIAPDESFSFNHRLGEVSETTGYQKAYIIKEGRTILGDGGGVCQVSTTFFRAVLAAGLPITERHAHAYRVSYYEQKTAVGLDATVYDPTADLKFENDTPAYILVQTRVDLKAKKLTFELYGTSDGRRVTIGKSRLWDQVPPPPAFYQDDPSLPVGVKKQIDWPAWGAKAAFDWQVIRHGEVLQERTFYSHYKPWQAVYLVGTKVD
jgi:vancomycin resistance protein YoaR